MKQRIILNIPLFAENLEAFLSFLNESVQDSNTRRICVYMYNVYSKRRSNIIGFYETVEKTETNEASFEEVMKKVSKCMVQLLSAIDAYRNGHQGGMAEIVQKYEDFILHSRDEAAYSAVWYILTKKNQNSVLTHEEFENEMERRYDRAHRTAERLKFKVQNFKRFFKNYSPLN